jgi:hypothetical protein
MGKEVNPIEAMEVRAKELLAVVVIAGEEAKMHAEEAEGERELL